MKQSSRRHRFEIVAGILEQCSDWSRPIPMLSRLQVNSSEGMRLLEVLVNKGLLEKMVLLKRKRTGSCMLGSDPKPYSRNLFRRTERGCEFLRLWKLVVKVWYGEAR